METWACKRCGSHWLKYDRANEYYFCGACGREATGEAAMTRDSGVWSETDYRTKLMDEQKALVADIIEKENSMKVTLAMRQQECGSCHKLYMTNVSRTICPECSLRRDKNRARRAVKGSGKYILKQDVILKAIGQKGWTKKHLAAKMDRSCATIYSWLKEREDEKKFYKYPSRSSVEALSKILGMEIDEIATYRPDLAIKSASSMRLKIKTDQEAMSAVA